MAGLQGVAWHLEIVDDAECLDANPPGEEDLLIVYRGEQCVDDDLARLRDTGARRVPGPASKMRALTADGRVENVDTHLDRKR